MMTCFGRDFFGSETVLDTFEPSSNMLISTWLASTILNSGTHVKTKCYSPPAFLSRGALRALQDFSPSRRSVLPIVFLVTRPQLP